MIHPYIHNSRQYYPKRNTSLSGGIFDNFLSEAIKTEKIKQAKESEKIFFSTYFSLNQIGLSLEPTTLKSNIILIVADQSYQPQTLEFNLDKGQKYLSFLSQLNPSDLAQNGLETYLEELTLSLANQLCGNYNLSKPTDQALELIINLGKITAECQRLGIQGKSLLLSDLSQLNQARILREYLSVYRSGLLPTDQSVPKPEDWPFFYPPENFLQKWNQSLTTLREIKQNSKARDLYYQLKFTLLNSIELSYSKIKASKSESDIIAPKYLDILFTIKEELKEI